VSANDFPELVAPHRDELRLHCYRMLGSRTDAEDLVQETLLAAWRGWPDFQGRSSIRTWLYRIATNRCLNAIRDGSRRTPPPIPGPPFAPPPPSGQFDIPWLQPYPDVLLDPESHYLRRETVELAFITGLQRLPPRQSAALILCDVLRFPTATVADMLGTSPVAVKGTLQRARTTMSHPATAAPAADSPAERALTRRFADAFLARDLDAVVALLTDDAWLTMPPAPHEYHGRAAISDFLRASPTWHRLLTLTATRVNTQPAYACRLDDTPAGLLVLTLRGARIAGLTRFLPAALPALADLVGTVKITV
jgi:RNA polymerase sigma-70 factor (TIGR02960 family)